MGGGVKVGGCRNNEYPTPRAAIERISSKCEDLNPIRGTSPLPGKVDEDVLAHTPPSKRDGCRRQRRKTAGGHPAFRQSGLAHGHEQGSGTPRNIGIAHG